jgi:hypothetical protein
MAFIIADRVQMNTSTFGTGQLTLVNPAIGYRTFGSVCANGDTAPYCLTDDTGSWEIGIGTYTSIGTLFARTTVLSSSNSNALINLSTGGIVFLTIPAATYNSLTTTANAAQTSAQVAAAITSYGYQTSSQVTSIANQSASSAVTPKFGALTIGSTISWNSSTINAATLTLTGAFLNPTLGMPSPLTPGSYMLFITQGGTGTPSYTIAWATGYKFPGGVKPVLSTVAGSTDVISFFSDGVSMYGSYLRGLA